MNLDLIVEIVNSKLIEMKKTPLNTTEVIVFRGIWENQTYSQIAQKNAYSPGYLSNIVAPQLWKRLSKLIGEQVTKKNCRISIEDYVKNRIGSELRLQIEFALDNREIQVDSLPSYPSGPLSSDSPFYIERDPTEKLICQEISKPGTLIRIKAPQEMGKTSLLLKTLDYAQNLGYQTVTLNLEQTDRAILNDLNRLLRWICANISRQLKFEPNLDEYWDDDIGSSISCTLYLQEHILQRIQSPLVLAFDRLNRIFEYPQIAKDFLPLLRSWYEEANKIDLWKKLRQIIVHSTEIYVPLQLKQSPFNIGLPIQLNDFNQEQINQLAKKYNLNWEGDREVKKLMETIGGHPAMVQITLYYISRGQASLAEIIEDACTLNGIYSHYLQRHQACLEEQPELAAAFNDVINANEPIQLEPTVAYKLVSMGLIELNNNKAKVRYKLNSQYFKQNFKNI